MMLKSTLDHIMSFILSFEFKIRLILVWALFFKLFN